ncbi:MAG: ribonuclease HII [Rhodothermales bacterium]|nr:ribonuclease HII [Rhodothermales bacterium]
MAGLRIERRLWSAGHKYVAGADEAGRGCLAGPVVAAAVVFAPDQRLRGVTDSKLLSVEAREKLATRIRSRALAVAVGVCSPREIDRLNILWASMEAMRRAILKLAPQPSHVLVDGNHVIPDSVWPIEAVIRGDLKSQSIAAASIIAKVERDRLMHELHETHPEYGWISNVGYPTRAHYEALSVHGASPLHRTTFNLENPYPPFPAEATDIEPTVGRSSVRSSSPVET